MSILKNRERSEKKLKNLQGIRMKKRLAKGRRKVRPSVPLSLNIRILLLLALRLSPFPRFKRGDREWVRFHLLTITCPLCDIHSLVSPSLSLGWSPREERRKMEREGSSFFSRSRFKSSPPEKFSGSRTRERVLGRWSTDYLFGNEQEEKGREKDEWWGERRRQSVRRRRIRIIGEGKWVHLTKKDSLLDPDLEITENKNLLKPSKNLSGEWQEKRDSLLEWERVRINCFLLSICCCSSSSFPKFTDPRK